MSSIGQRRVSTSVEKGSIGLRLSISRPLAKVTVGSIGIRGDTVAVGEGSIDMSSIGQRRVSTSVEKGSIGLRLSISRPLAKVTVGSIGIRGDTVAVGEGSI